MGLKDWFVAGVIIFTVGVPTAHGHTPAPDSKDPHTHAEKCEAVRTKDNISMVQTTGNHVKITVPSGALHMEGQEPEVK